MSSVTVDTLFEMRIADFARMKFEAEGIPVLMNATGQALLFWTAIMGGVRVEMPEEFAYRAAAVIHEVMVERGCGALVSVG